MKKNDKIAVEFLPERIKRLRMAGGLSQAQLAALIGISSTAVCNWETGEYMPKGRYLPRLAEVLSVGLEELMDVTKSIDDLTEEVVLLTAFRGLPKERQLIAIKMIEALKLDDC